MNTKVLICDDDVDMVHLISKSLIKNKYDVDVITQMDDFMDKVKDMDPDIILMDISMPETDGVEAAKMLHSENSTAHIPLVFMSANANIEKYAQQLNKLYIKKPFDVRQLRSILNIYSI